MAVAARRVEESPEERALALLEAVRSGAIPRPEQLELRGLVLADADLSGLDLSGYDLSEADLSRCNLERARLIRANLRGAVLFEASLDEADLTGADLTDAHLTFCTARRTGFGSATLENAELMSGQLQGATFTHAKMRHADLRAAYCKGTRFRDADLREADLSGTDLHDADFSDSKLHRASFNHADLRESKFSGAVGYEQADWVQADLRHVDFNGAYLLRRFAHDQNYLAEFRSQSRTNEALYWVWWLTSDCGRSIARWSLLILFNVLLFSMLYTWVGVDFGDHRTPLSPIYFSVVTLTSLGFGDVVPTSILGQAAVIVQVSCGYMMLGGLMSIFANKMARRAD
jgi:uncharacterized protein YjbI with pentapeptide repeats